MLNFRSNVIDKSNYDLLSYKVESDFKYSLSLKYKLPETQVRFKGGYYYSDIKGNGLIRNINPSANSIDIETQVNNSLTTVTLGLEYLTELQGLKPYLGVDLLLGVFGDSDITFPDKYDKPNEKIFPSKTRVGLGLSGGVSYLFFPGMELDINLVYSSLNFLGKEAYEDHIITTDLSVNLLFVF